MFLDLDFLIVVLWVMRYLSLCVALVGLIVLSLNEAA